MRILMTVFAPVLALTATGLTAGDEPVPPRRVEKTIVQSTPKAAAKAPAKTSAAPAVKGEEKASGQPTAKRPAASGVASEIDSARNSDDEDAIRQTGETFSKAYDRGDAKAVAAHFTSDAEYIDEQGNVFQGRQAIEESLASFFKENPGSQLEVAIDSIRFVGPGVAIEDGTTTVTHAAGSLSDYSRYTAVHIKTNGKWLTASSREHAPKNRRQHAAQLQQLDWLLGEWVDEGDDSIVDFSCKAVDNGNFLLREFNVRIAGQAAMSGSQRIGWDPVSGKLRTWIFDSEGGHGEGTWQRNGDSWVVKSTGVTADGQPASSTSLFTMVSGHAMTWQAIDREIEGVRLPDTDEYILVRAPPSPSAADRPVAKN
jgi:uncharacterized protein (TIGR02246 family)